MKTKVLQLNNTGRKVFWILSMGIGCAIGLYFYFVIAAAVHAAELEGMQRNIQLITTDISEMESKYIKLNDQINIENAQSFGFKEAKNVKFATRQTFVSALSEAEGGIR